ncbi:MAG TPA: efflux RND transporter periplasmic adaptor subunit [Steroidobacteraceae bacterium]|jgi:cobalt-zinc-cadmium efflux system membrane fusion protein|nr:efflux RND transporter periplasmic adaptor subunit [Steroidobacteraceae bacterium]
MPIHDHEPSFRGRAFLWGGIALGLLFLAALFTHGFGLIGGSGRGAAEPALMVRQGDKILVPEGSALRGRLSVMPAPTQAVSAKLTLPAIVESDPARTAAVLTPLAGRLIELKVALGQRVSRGQVLAVIDSPDLGQAFDDDVKAADTFKLTEKNLKRQEAQNALGTASDRDLDQAKSDHAQAAAEYARTQARLKMLGASPDDKPASRRLTVTAPMGGSITALAVAPGTMINDPTQPMMTIADLSTVWVTALVPEKDVASVAKNQDADVDLLAYPARVLKGKVLFVSDVIEPDSRRDKIRIAFANSDYALKPNMYATVTLTGPELSQVVLPSSALLMNNDRTTVFVATAPWTFERRIVDPKLEEGSSVAIRSGVKAGEQVVVKGGILLND